MNHICSPWKAWTTYHCPWFPVASIISWQLFKNTYVKHKLFKLLQCPSFHACIPRHHHQLNCICSINTYIVLVCCSCKVLFHAVLPQHHGVEVHQERKPFWSACTGVQGHFWLPMIPKPSEKGPLFSTPNRYPIFSLYWGVCLKHALILFAMQCHPNCPLRPQPQLYMFCLHLL